MTRKVKIGLGSLFVLLGLWLLVGLFGSWISTYPRLVKIPPAHQYFEASQIVEKVSFSAQDNQIIKAWWLPVDTSERAVILLSGIGGNRAGMVGRAKIYRDLGFNVLMPDLRGTGESAGGKITFGWQERWDLLAGKTFLGKKEMAQIGVHGCSLGAATICYSLEESKPDYHFVVLESPYDNIEQALENRIDLFHFPLFLFRPLIWWTEWRLGVSAEQLAPEKAIEKNTAPTLLLAGDSEQKVKKSETEKIFSRCAAEEKELYFFKGGKHEDFERRFRPEYRRVLEKWLRKVVLKELKD